jgi:hypothetical protein
MVCTGDGMPIMWCLANPKIGEREVVAALLEHTVPGLSPGVLTRVAQRLLTMATGIWHNWTTSITSKRSLTAYDH